MRLLFYIVSLALCLTVASTALAHPLDASFLDFGPTTSTGATVNMTVAIHDHEAYELVRPVGDTHEVDLELLRKNADLVTAYAATHIIVQRAGEACAWNPLPALVPENGFDAIADGIAVMGPLTCPGEGSVLDVGSSLFLERFPSQVVIIRLESPDGFIERVVIDRARPKVKVDISSVLPPEQNHQENVVDDDAFIEPGLIMAFVIAGMALFFLIQRKKR